MEEARIGGIDFIAMQSLLLSKPFPENLRSRFLFAMRLIVLAHRNLGLLFSKGRDILCSGRTLLLAIFFGSLISVRTLHL